MTIQKFDKAFHLAIRLVSWAIATFLASVWFVEFRGN